jgi:hypothetical protein
MRALYFYSVFFFYLHRKLSGLKIIYIHVCTCVATCTCMYHIYIYIHTCICGHIQYMYMYDVYDTVYKYLYTVHMTHMCTFNILN